MNFATSSPPQSSNALTIIIHDALGESGSLAEHHGHKIYELIEAAFEKGQSVTLSFKNLKKLTWSFVTASLGRLSASYPEEQLASQLSLVDIDPEEVAFIEKVIDTRKAYRQNPAQFQGPSGYEEIEKLLGSTSNHPWMKFSGMYKDNPLFAEVVAYIEEERREDAQMDAYYSQDAEGEAK